MGNENHTDSNGFCYGKIYIRTAKPFYFPGEEITGKNVYSVFS